MRSLYALFLCAGFALLLAASPAMAQQCGSGTITVTVSSDPGFEGLYKYCVDSSWDLDQFGISHLDVFLQLPDCPCICDPNFVKFATPAGSASPPDGSCQHPFLGQYVCKGDPSLPDGVNGPAVKFTPDAVSTCDVSLAGSGTFCFYSPMPPAPSTTHSSAIAIKHGQQTCYGDLVGSLPTCDCALPTQTTTWGNLKATYR